MKYWWKERDYFKFPGMKFYYSFKYAPMMYKKRTSHFWQYIVKIDYIPLQYKLKFLDYCLEQVPYFNVTLFNVFHLGIMFSNGKYNEDAYWECLLQHLYNGDALDKCVEENTWKRFRKGPEDYTAENVYTQDMLTNYGRRTYERLIEERKEII